MLLREQKEMLVERLQQMSGRLIAFHTPPTPHVQSIYVRDELVALFERAGWPYEMGTSLLADTTLGICLYRLRRSRDDAQNADAFKRLKQAFVDIGMRMAFQEIDEPGSGTNLIIAVGRLA